MSTEVYSEGGDEKEYSRLYLSTVKNPGYSSERGNESGVILLRPKFDLTVVVIRSLTHFKTSLRTTS